ncbi:hypothetical protein, partial [Escherichia coli]|uniref:hypothetical protein n=1 Tax=Escherichia coli TaxID=562 RepID=UPI00256F5381
LESLHAQDEQLQVLVQRVLAPVLVQELEDEVHQVLRLLREQLAELQVPPDGPEVLVQVELLLLREQLVVLA